ADHRRRERISEVRKNLEGNFPDPLRLEPPTPAGRSTNCPAPRRHRSHRPSDFLPQRRKSAKLGASQRSVPLSALGAFAPWPEIASDPPSVRLLSASFHRPQIFR